MEDQPLAKKVKLDKDPDSHTMDDTTMAPPAVDTREAATTLEEFFEDPIRFKPKPEFLTLAIDVSI
jgi:hypothetical protein